MTEQKNSDLNPVTFTQHINTVDTPKHCPTAESVASFSANKPELPATAELQASNQRSIEEIADMILQQKGQVVQSFIKIGFLLIEAKQQLVRHGQWRQWLIYHVDISERMAERYMQLAKAYGNSTSVSDLGITKALILLELPEEDREAFINDLHEINGEMLPIEKMTTRETRKAVHDKCRPVVKKEESPKVFQPIYKDSIPDVHDEEQDMISKLMKAHDYEINSVKTYFDSIKSFLAGHKYDADTYDKLGEDMRSLKEIISQCIDLIEEKKECADFS